MALSRACFNPTLVRLRRLPDAAGHPGAGRFNPTLVRLRHGDLYPLLPARSRFNPTLVRLRQNKLKARQKGLLAFQSHAGSIEARPQQKAQGRNELPFQSHAGSIEAEVLRASQCGDQLFQSHAGSIEAQIRRDLPPLHPGFNPTLVRLRLSRADVFLRRSCMVSIPRWFD